MGIVQLAKNWSMKPPLGAQINPSHPLAHGLMRAYVFNEGGGCPVDLVRNRAASAIGPDTAWQAGPNGPVLRFAQSGSNYVVDPDAVSNGPLTFVVKCLWDGTGHPSQYIWLFNYGWGVYANSPAGQTGLNFVRSWTTNYDAKGISNFFTSSNANKWFHFVWVSPGGLGSHIVYNNGVPNVGTINGSGTPYDISGFTIGAYDSAGSSAGPWPGQIDHVLFYNRALSPQEAQALYLDNFCFMQPQSPK
jgi:hypothetical protein